MVKISIFALFLSFAPISKASPPWTNYAAKLSGYSEAERRKAILALRPYPHLAEELKRQLLGEEKYLALEVISALGLSSFLPQLKSLSARDENGALYLTINTLVTKENYADISRFYVDRFRKRGPISDPALVVILDTLGRFDVALDEAEILEVYADRSPEVRSAVLYYVRLLGIEKKELVYKKLIKQALADPAFSLRLQALYLLGDLAKLRISGISTFLSLCAKDDNQDVREKCLSLGKRRS